MYALERRMHLRTERRPRDCWTRYAVHANRPLLEKVRAGQPKPKNRRVAAIPCTVKDNFEMPVQADAGKTAA